MLGNMKNKTSDYEFTVVVPVYNEAPNIARIEQAFDDFLPISVRHTCVLFVNDGSVDESLSLIRNICASKPDYYYISFEHNAGLSAALKAGIDWCQSPYVGYIDADLQTSPRDFNQLLAYISNHELVSGIRTGRKDSFGKRLQSKIANSFRRWMTGDTAQDTGCPLKVMHTDYAQRVPFFNGMHRFLPALFGLLGGRFMQVPVQHFPRVAGVSKFHLSNRLIGPFVDCFVFRWMRSRFLNYTVGENNLCEPDSE